MPLGDWFGVKGVPSIITENHGEEIKSHKELQQRLRDALGNNDTKTAESIIKELKTSNQSLESIRQSKISLETLEDTSMRSFEE